MPRRSVARISFGILICFPSNNSRRPTVVDGTLGMEQCIRKLKKFFFFFIKNDSEPSLSVSFLTKFRDFLGHPRNINDCKKKEIRDFGFPMFFFFF